MVFAEDARMKQFDPAQCSSPLLEVRIVDTPGVGQAIVGRGATNTKRPLVALRAVPPAGREPRAAGPGPCGVGKARGTLAAVAGLRTFALGAGLGTLVRPFLVQTLRADYGPSYISGRVAPDPDYDFRYSSVSSRRSRAMLLCTLRSTWSRRRRTSAGGWIPPATLFPGSPASVHARLGR